MTDETCWCCGSPDTQQCVRVPALWDKRKECCHVCLAPVPEHDSVDLDGTYIIKADAWTPEMSRGFDEGHARSEQRIVDRLNAAD